MALAQQLFLSSDTAQALPKDDEMYLCTYAEGPEATDGIGAKTLYNASLPYSRLEGRTPR
jgi:hypothetical protein